MILVAVLVVYFRCCLHYTTVYASYEVNFKAYETPANNLRQLYHINQLQAPQDVITEMRIKSARMPTVFGNNFKLQAALSSELAQFKGSLDKSIHSDDKNMFVSNYPRAVFESQDINTNALKEFKKERSCTDSHQRNAQQIFVGTNLFVGYRKKCFSGDDVALLTARKDFEMLIPRDIDFQLVDDRRVGVLMKYFYTANEIVQRTRDEEAKRILESALYDTLGGYLKHFLLPIAKLSFYAGEVSDCTVENIIGLYEQSKMILNTNGNGWREPNKNLQSQLKKQIIKPLDLEDQKSEQNVSSCANLDLTIQNNCDAADDRMLVPLPKLETNQDGFLDNIWLPFKKKRIYNLRSKSSAFILVNFYETVTNCFKFQSASQDVFDRKLKDWIMENVHLHLPDEQFYPGLGAILRLQETLICNKKNQIKKDEYDYHDNDNDKTNINNNNNNNNSCCNNNEKYNCDNNNNNNNSSNDNNKNNNDDEGVDCSKYSNLNCSDKVHKNINEVRKRYDKNNDYQEKIAFKVETKPKLTLVENAKQQNVETNETKNNIDYIYTVSKSSDLNGRKEVINNHNKDINNEESGFHGLTKQDIYIIAGSVLGGLLLISIIVYSVISFKRRQKFSSIILPECPPSTLELSKHPKFGPNSSTAKFLPSDSAQKSITSKSFALAEPSSASPMLCQLPRGCLPLPYSTLGAHALRKEIIYSTTTDGESDFDRKPKHKPKGVNKKCNNNPSGVLSGQDKSSWGTTYLFN